MASPWIAASPGVRYKEHPTRRHGKKPDRYWCLQYRRNGKTHGEAVGWWSQGASQAQAEAFLMQLRQNWRSGTGPQTLKELRAAGLADREAVAQQQIKITNASMTLSDFWAKCYLPSISIRKTAKTISVESWLFKTWIEPVMGARSLKGIAPQQIESVLSAMTLAGKSPRTIKYALVLITGIIAEAIKQGFIDGPNPGQAIKLPKKDNKRTRFLTPAEARLLLDALKARSPQTHDEAVPALFCGLRAGEIFALTWSDIDFENRQILIRDPKNRKNRHAYMTGEVEEVLRARRRDQAPSDLVFSDANGHKQVAASKSFKRIVIDLGFNEGVDDTRQKVVFHTLRHTYASWLVQAGEPLFTVQKLLGHSSLAMTERYAHLAPDHLRQAADRLEGKLNSIK